MMLVEHHCLKCTGWKVPKRVQILRRRLSRSQWYALNQTHSTISFPLLSLHAATFFLRPSTENYWLILDYQFVKDCSKSTPPPVSPSLIRHISDCYYSLFDCLIPESQSVCQPPHTLSAPPEFFWDDLHNPYITIRLSHFLFFFLFFCRSTSPHLLIVYFPQ